MLLLQSVLRRLICGVMVEIRVYYTLFPLCTPMLGAILHVQVTQSVVNLLQISLRCALSEYLSACLVPVTFSHSLPNPVKLGFYTHPSCYQ